MIRIVTAALLAIVLSGCALKELKAPCKNIAALASGPLPCEQREPVNSAEIPSVFARP